jgi:hypothetical protein
LSTDLWGVVSDDRVRQSFFWGASFETFIIARHGETDSGEGRWSVTSELRTGLSESHNRFGNSVWLYFCQLQGLQVEKIKKSLLELSVTQF